MKGYLVRRVIYFVFVVVFLPLAAIIECGCSSGPQQQSNSTQSEKQAMPTSTPNYIPIGQESDVISGWQLTLWNVGNTVDSSSGIDPSSLQPGYKYVACGFRVYNAGGSLHGMISRTNFSLADISGKNYDQDAIPTSEGEGDLISSFNNPGDVGALELYYAVPTSVNEFVLSFQVGTVPPVAWKFTA